MRLRCFNCNKVCSSEMPEDVVVRGIAECPECSVKLEDERSRKLKDASHWAFAKREIALTLTCFIACVLGIVGGYGALYYEGWFQTSTEEPCLDWEEAVPWECVYSDQRCEHMERDFHHCASVCCDKMVFYAEMLQEEIRCTIDKIEHEEEMDLTAKVYGECLDRVDELEGRLKVIDKSKEWERINDLILSNDFNDRRCEWAAPGDIYCL